MGWNWNNYETAFKMRRKNSDFKRMWRDVDLTKDENETFHLTYAPRVWIRNAENKWVTAPCDDPQPLATITKDNVLTLLYEPRPTITVANRLTTLLGRYVFSDTSRHRNKEHTVRIRTAKWHASTRDYKIDPWHPAGVVAGDFQKGTMPYKAGTQFKLSEYTGEPIQLLTPVEDTKILVKPESVSAVKAEGKVLKTLVRAMARVGVFDEEVTKRMKSPYGYRIPNVKPLREVVFNLATPTAEDATAVFLRGMLETNIPNRSHYVKGVWTTRSEEDVQREFVNNAVDRGMYMFRQEYYAHHDGYENVVAQRY